MMNHLLKRCPNTTQEERSHAFFHMQHTSVSGKSKKQAARSQHDTQDTSYGQVQMQPGIHQGLEQQTLPNFPAVEHRHHMASELQHDMQQGLSSNLQLQLLMQRQQSALDTLAEVSRRHMDYSVQNTGYASQLQDASLQRQPNRIMVEQALLAALQRSDGNDSNVPHPVHVQPDILPMYSNYTTQAQAGAQQTAFSDAQAPMPLVQTATAATEQMEPDYEIEEAPLDPQLGDQMNIEPTPPAPDYAPEQLSQADLVAWSEKPQDFVTQQNPPSNEPNPEFGLPHRSDKVNARARFNDTRRKEVQEVRKRGACMRCRMLKKPCSEGTPCGTCKKIDSARLWKGTCLRTKLAGEFTLYSASYFHSKIAPEVSKIVQGHACSPLPGRVEVKLISYSDLAVTFSAKRCMGPIDADGTHNLQSSDVPLMSSSHEILILDGDPISHKVTDYCASDAVVEACIENEEVVFQKVTLREALKLLEAERLQEASTSQKTGSRTNHISPSILLQNVIELWVETKVLVSGQGESSQIRYNGTMPSSTSLQNATWSEKPGQSPSFSSLNVASQHLIRSQLLAATENACHKLSKAITNELERRLLQRQQVSAFGTFISAIILFTCMERITAFYYSLDPSPSQDDDKVADADTADAHVRLNLGPPGHPLGVPSPSSLWRQGPHFARLLTTLLRMRALPPKTTRTAQNKLAVLLEPGLPVRLNGVAVREQQDANTARATEWLDALGLDVDELRAKRDADVARTGWDMKFVSEVLLGEGV